MAQFARPVSDLDNTGGWTTTPLWSDIDEGGAGDGTVILSDTTPVVTEPFTVDLSTITDPTVSTGHILRIRWAKNAGGGGNKTIRIELREGYVNESSQGTLIATDDYAINSTTLRTDATTLSAGEANSITDYSDLQIRIMGVAGNRALKVDFAELETPDAAQFIAIGTLAETNSLIGVTAEKEAQIGTLAEVESLIPAQARKVAPVGTLAETDTLNPVQAIKRATIGTLAESETLLSIQARKFASIGTLAESNNLIPVAVVMGSGQDIAVTTLAEIESLLAVSAEKGVQVGVMSEINNLIGVAGSKTAQIGVLAELNTLIGVEALKPIFVTVGILGESNLLIPISAFKEAQIGTLSEIEILIAIQALKPIIRSVGTLAELNALIAIAAEVLGQGWWTKNPADYAQNPVGFTKAPVDYTKNVPSGPGPG